MSRDLSRVALSTHHEVRLLDGSGRLIHALQHPPFGGNVESGACAFDPDGRHLWAVVPRVDGGVDLRLLQLDSLRELDRATLDACPAGLEPLSVPGGQVLGWSIGEGQDGAFIRWSRQVDGHIGLRRAETDDRILAAIHPDGVEYLTTPHSGVGPLLRHRVVDDAAIATLDQPRDEFWDLHACYLDAEHILAMVEEQETLMLVRREPLAVTARIACVPTQSRWRYLSWAGRGRWLMGGDAGLEMWTLEQTRSR